MARGRNPGPGVFLAVLTLGLAGALAVPAAFAQLPPAPPLPSPAEPETPVYSYHTYPSLVADLQRLADAHADLARLKSIGQSRGGLDLWSLEIGNPNQPGYAALPALVVDGGHHGNEPLGVEGAYLFAAALLAGYANDSATRAAVDAHRIFVIPLVNPDGHLAGLRQNGALVDLARNYPFHWNERGSGPRGDATYAGAAAESEPETHIMAEFLARVHPDVYVSLRGGADDVVRPWGHAPEQPVPDEALYQQLLGWAFTEAGLASRYPAGSGESCDWAYGAEAMFCVTLDARVPLLSGGPPPRPVGAADVHAALEPAFRLLRYLLGTAERWGGHLIASVENIEGNRGFLVLRNAGFGDARNVDVTATGLTLLAEAPRALGPEDAARIPVLVDGPARAHAAYDRLAVPPAHSGTARAWADGVVEFRTVGIEPKPTPGPEVGLVLVLASAAALAFTRGRRGNQGL